MPGYFIEEFDLRTKPNTTRLFLAEGHAEVGFLEAELARRSASPDAHTILCFQGVQRLHEHSNTIVKLIDPVVLQKIVAFGVLADSEDNPDGRLASVIDCAKAFGFERAARDLSTSGQYSDGKKRFAVSLSPSIGKTGRIETLVLQEISSHGTMKCILESLPCITRANNGRTVDEKAQVQMFISAAMNNSFAGIRRAFVGGLFDSRHAAYERHVAMVDYVVAV